MLRNFKTILQYFFLHGSKKFLRVCQNVPPPHSPLELGEVSEFQEKIRNKDKVSLNQDKFIMRSGDLVFFFTCHENISDIAEE